MATETFLLTYFSNKTRDEFDSIILDLYSALSKDFKNPDRLANKIINLFVDKFDPDYLLCNYSIDVSSSFEKAIKSTLKYPIDTEIMIRYIYDKLSEEDIN